MKTEGGMNRDREQRGRPESQEKGRGGKGQSQGEGHTRQREGGEGRATDAQRGRAYQKWSGCNKERLREHWERGKFEWGCKSPDIPRKKKPGTILKAESRDLSGNTKSHEYPHNTNLGCS